MTTLSPRDLLFLAWCECTGQENDPRVARQNERIIWEFINAGFTAEELKRVCAYMKHENSKGGRFKLQLHKVAGDLERFASILSDLKAKDRNRRPAPTPKEQVMGMRDRIVDTESADPRINGTGRHLSDVLKKMSEQ